MGTILFVSWGCVTFLGSVYVLAHMPFGCPVTQGVRGSTMSSVCLRNSSPVVRIFIMGQALGYLLKS